MTHNEMTTRMIPLTRWSEYHPYPSLGGLRWIRFRAKEFGFESAFKTVGRRVLVYEAEFLRLIRDQKLNCKGD